jgi:hypothetical protein
MLKQRLAHVQAQLDACSSSSSSSSTRVVPKTSAAAVSPARGSSVGVGRSTSPSSSPPRSPPRAVKPVSTSPSRRDASPSSSHP